jgi:hypothetical protein
VASRWTTLASLARDVEFWHEVPRGQSGHRDGKGGEPLIRKGVDGENWPLNGRLTAMNTPPV